MDWFVISHRVGFTWSTIQLTFAPENDRNLVRYLFLTFFVRKQSFNFSIILSHKIYIFNFFLGLLLSLVLFFTSFCFFLLSLSFFQTLFFSLASLLSVSFLSFLSPLVSLFSVSFFYKGVPIFFMWIFIFSVLIVW